MPSQGIVATVARSGLDKFTPNLHLATGGDEFEERIGGVSPVGSGEFAAHDMRRARIEIRRQSGLESVGENAGSHRRQYAATVPVRLQSFGDGGLADFTLNDVILARDFCQNVVVVISFAALAGF